MLRLSLLGLSFVALACVSTSLEVPETHPAHPNATRAPAEARSQTLAQGYDPLAGDGDETAPSGHDHGGHAVWSCPMHPEIQRPAPGKCPICGMNLVEKRAAPGPRP